MFSAITALPILLALSGPTANLSAGQEAPAFVLPLLNAELAKQKRFSFRSTVGDEAVVPASKLLVSFVASYCKPCKKELRYLNKNRRKLKAAGIEVIVVVVDTETAGIEKMERYLVKKLKFRLPAGVDRFGIVAQRYEVEDLPTLVVVGQDGEVERVRRGYRKGGLRKLFRKLGVFRKRRG